MLLIDLQARDLPASDLLALLDTLLQSKVSGAARDQRREHKQHICGLAEGMLQAAASGAAPLQLAFLAAYAVDTFSTQVGPEWSLH